MKKGSVTLVGAGPGDPGLMTLKGARALEKADVVVYDRLLSPEILSMIPSGTEKIDVGKTSGSHPVPQGEINSILLEKALGGKNVVRLKGGDPFIFGRGGEELEALEKSGVGFEVVPGVTSAAAAPAYAGIPLTHRDYSSSFHVVTAHARSGRQPDINFAALAGCGGTIVFLMGAGKADELCRGLIDAGMDGATPAAVVENGTAPEERKFVSDLKNLPFMARENAVHSPAVLVVGRVCALSEKLDWFSKKPLFGTKIVVTRNEGPSGELAARLRALGAGVVDFPCMEIEEIKENKTLDAALEKLGSYGHLVFTSAKGVDIFFRQLKEKRLDARALAGHFIAAVGGRTAKALEARGVFADFVPEAFDGEHLALGLSRRALPQEKLLILRAEKGTPELTEVLKENGVEFEDVPLYRTLSAKGKHTEKEKLFTDGLIDYVAFTSGSAVEGFVRSLSIDFSKLKAVAIGRKTAETAEKYGIRCEIAKTATIEAVAEKIVEVKRNGTC